MSLVHAAGLESQVELGGMVGLGPVEGEAIEWGSILLHGLALPLPRSDEVSPAILCPPGVHVLWAGRLGLSSPAGVSELVFPGSGISL